MTSPQPALQPAIINPTELDFSQSLAVLRCADRFILPVPKFVDGGEALVFPASSPRAGEPIKDTAADQGVVFFNAAGNAWEGARGDGKSTIVINNVTKEQATRLLELVTLGGRETANLSLTEIKEILNYAATGLGLGDFYPKKKEHIDRDLARGTEWSAIFSRPELYLGVLKVLDKEPIYAMFVDRPFRVTTPSDQTHQRGGFIVQDKEGRRWPVETQAFLNTYRFADCSRIASVEQFRVAGGVGARKDNG